MKAVKGYRKAIVFTSRDDDKKCFDKIINDVLEYVDGRFIDFDLSGLDILYEHCWGNHQHFFKDGVCELDDYFCEDSPKCYLVAMEKYNSLHRTKKGETK